MRTESVLIPAEKKLPSSAGPRYSLVLSTDPGHIEAAQRLRRDVFGSEPGFALFGQDGDLDVDRFDEYCDHLLVREEDSGEWWAATACCHRPARSPLGGTIPQRYSTSGRWIHYGRRREDGSCRRASRPPQRCGRPFNVGRHPGVPRPLQLRLRDRMHIGTGRCGRGTHPAPRSVASVTSCRAATLPPAVHRAIPRRTVVIDGRPLDQIAPPARPVIPPLMRSYLRLGARRCCRCWRVLCRAGRNRGGSTADCSCVASGVKITVSDGPIRNLPGVLVVSDHMSWLGILTIGAALPSRRWRASPLSFAARADVAAASAVRMMARVVMVIPIERAKLRQPSRGRDHRRRQAICRSIRWWPSRMAPPGVAGQVIDIGGRGRSTRPCSRPPLTPAARFSRCGCATTTPAVGCRRFRPTSATTRCCGPPHGRAHLRRIVAAFGQRSSGLGAPLSRRYPDQRDAAFNRWPAVVRAHVLTAVTSLYCSAPPRPAPRPAASPRASVS